MQSNVKVILTRTRIVLSDFLAVIGHSWDLYMKRNCTDITVTCLLEFGTKTSEKMMMDFPETAHPFSVLPTHFRDEKHIILGTYCRPSN